MERVLNFSRDDSGAAAVEYSLLLASIAIAAAGTVAIFGTVINNLFAGAAALFPG